MITQFDVDGVPALFSPASGPMKAGLAFRVGFADEPLPKRGITHLLEHLALHTAGVADYHYNGATGVEHTHFHLQGSESDIVSFLNGVCSSLLEPPLQRLQVEKEILKTEAASRRVGAGERMPAWRHGARDYGLSSYPEWGLNGITEADLRAWVQRYFVRQNAVLWVAGSSMPTGLRLVLPDGERQPVPRVSSSLPSKPAYFKSSPAGVVWDSVVRREQAAGVFAVVLERELFRSLRQEGGLSYTVAADYEPRADGTAVITAVADALPDKQDAVLGGFIDVLAAMRIGRIEQSEVTTVVNRACEGLVQAEEHGDRLPGQAFQLLAGRPVQSLEEILAEMRAVTLDDVVRVAAAAYEDGLLQSPATADADWAGYAPAPTTSEQAVTGQAYPGLEDPRTRLVLGEEGVSFVDDDTDEILTVRFDACPAMLAWPDGARQMVGADAITLRIEPSMFHGLGPAIPWLDAKIPGRLRVEMPAREPGKIPRPRPPAAPPATVPAPPRAPRPPGRTTAIITLVGLIPVAVIALLCAIGSLLTMADPDSTVAGAIMLAVFGLIVLVGAGWGIRWAIHRLRT